MVTAKLAFVLIEVGTNLLINPMQLVGIQKAPAEVPNCRTFIIDPSGNHCSDWAFEDVRKALSSAAVASAMEPK